MLYTFKIKLSFDPGKNINGIIINTKFRCLLYQIITMNTMFYAILFSMMAFATADIITIKNNCNVNFDIHDIYGPSGTGILCYPMTKLAVGKQITLNNFYPDEDVILTRASANLTSKSFNYVGTLKNIMRNEEDINGVCTKILKGGEIQVYTVKPGVSHLSLCAIKPKQNTIINKCSNKFEFAQVRVNPRINVLCSSSLIIPGGKQLSYTTNTPSYVIIKTTSTKDTPNFKYMGTLQDLIDLEGDADGKCKKLVKSGYNAVYEPIRAKMTLCGR